MSKALLAVYDSSKDYVDRFLDYIKKKHYLPFESIGFTDTKALENYLVRNKVDLLLYSKEEFVEETESLEPECELFIRHENVREFAYLGKRRNSKSRVNHINKYQSMKAILEEVRIILNEDNYYEEREVKEINVAGIYAICSSKKALRTSLILTAQKASRSNLLYINLDRFSFIENCSISDLIYFYKTDKEKLKETLIKTRATINSFDILSSPFDMNDIDEIKINEWPDFLSELSKAGEYDLIVVDMYEAFRNLEDAFDMCREIFVITDESRESQEKLEKLKSFFNARKRQDLINKISKISTEEF